MIPLPLNTQVSEKPVAGNGETLEVVDIFDTIQGEGPYAGRVAVFVRLAGCNLQCPSCDTDYTSNRRTLPVAQVVENIRRVNGRLRNKFSTDYQKHIKPLVVITGGEPFRQEIGELVRELMFAGWFVQIETNGTLYLENFPWWLAGFTVVCSPKAGSVHSKLQPFISDLKYVLRAGQIAADGLPMGGMLGSSVPPARPWPLFRGTVWIQPEDEKNDETNSNNTKVCVASAMQFGYRLGTQLHKTLDLP